MLQSECVILTISEQFLIFPKVQTKWKNADRMQRPQDSPVWLEGCWE